VQGGAWQNEAAQVIGSAVRTWLWIQDVYKRGIPEQKSLVSIS
jgi:hypothetical protein